MEATGISGLIRLAVWLETNEPNMETLHVGASDDVLEQCAAEIAGKWLFFKIALRGGGVWVSASPLDSADEPEVLLRIGDTVDGWRQIGDLILALETDQIRSLSRPIECGNWVIA